FSVFRHSSFQHISYCAPVPKPGLSFSPHDASPSSRAPWPKTTLSKKCGHFVGVHNVAPAETFCEVLPPASQNALGRCAGSLPVARSSCTLIACVGLHDLLDHLVSGCNSGRGGRSGAQGRGSDGSLRARGGSTGGGPSAPRR